LSFPGKRECKLYFPGISGIPGIEFYLIILEKGHFLRKKCNTWLTLYGAAIALYKRLHARDCGFLSKFVTVYGKYRKCQKNIHFYFKNPIPGNPGPISRESGTGKIVGIAGNGKGKSRE
jgi:hypothetical protein